MKRRRRAVVLGTGSVGSLAAGDLAMEPGIDVTAVDADERAAERLRGVAGVRFERADLSDPDAVVAATKGAAVVVNALPGALGFGTLRALIESDRNVVDVSFMPEDPFGVERSARERGVAAIVDCGVAPGLSNLLVGRAAVEFDPLESVRILVGGLPEVRRWPYEYCAVFSPADVIEEYTRPARLVEGGRVVAREALSEVEPVEFPGVGTLEAFNTDGLRTLLRTIQAPRMVEKTLRYPGHADRMRMLRDTGFFSVEPVEIGGMRIRPIDLTARLLFRKWRLPEGEGDVTVMRVEVEGGRGGRAERHRWEMVDRWDAAAGRTSMARATGYPAAIAARLVLRGEIRERGVLPPEMLGRDERIFRFFIDELALRSIDLRLDALPVPAAAG